MGEMMKLKFKSAKLISSVYVSILHPNDARKLGLNANDRVKVKKGKKEIAAVIDISDSLVKEGEIVCSEDFKKVLNLKNNDFVDVSYLPQPDAVRYIRKKLDGKELNKKEIDEIVRGIVSNELTEVEKTYFVSAAYCNGMSDREVVNLTKSVANHGETISFNGIVVDKHCAGGVPGNRTTMIIVPIIAAAGLIIPKTSSRSITSPAGTADTMEVLADVSYGSKGIKRIIDKANGCIVWGGGINLAPADDKLIKIRHPMSLDPKGLLLASILAKKFAVGSKYVLIDLPVGKGAKMNLKEAQSLSKEFIKIGKLLGMKVEVIITDGSEPIGRGIGPALEAYDVLKVLRQDKDRSLDLEQKALGMARIMLKMVNKNPNLADDILKSGKAYEKMKQIIKAQRGKILEPEQISFANYYYDYKAKKSGKIVEIMNKPIASIAKIAGAPTDKKAGIWLNFHVNDKVKAKETLFRVYAESKLKLNAALKYINEFEKNESIIKIKP